MAQQTTNAMMLSTSTTSDVSPDAMYSQPELIDTIVYPDFIELVYKRKYMITIGHRMPNPEIYAEVYSRRDGSMYTKKGTYIPTQPESYEF